MSDSDDDSLCRTMTSERSDADFVECFGDSFRKEKRSHPDPFAPSNDDDYFLDNHNVVDGIYVSSLVAPPEDEFPIGAKVFVVAEFHEIKQTMGPYFFEEKMFRLMGGARRITGKVLRHHGDYTVVEFVMPLEDMFSGTHSRKLGGGGFRRTSLQHRQSISLGPNGQTLYPNVSSYNNNNRRESLDLAAAVLNSTCAPPPSGAFAATIAGAGSTIGNLTVNTSNGHNHTTESGSPSNGLVTAAGADNFQPEIKKLALGGLLPTEATNGRSSSSHSHGKPPTSARNRSNLASPRTPRGGAALLSPRSQAAQAEKIIVSFTLHRSVIEVDTM